jgi:hypothetical protein
MIKLIDILKNVINEGVTLNNDDILNINIIKSTDTPEDPFFINRDKKFVKKGGISTYYGISPNPSLSGNLVTTVYNNTKDINDISAENLNKLILLTAPSISVDYIISLPSSAGLNSLLLNALQQKYKVLDKNILSNISKIEYFIDNMVNQERYLKADPTTQKMTDTWTRSLKKCYPDNPKMPIKKSSSRKSGHPGLQSGARGLLNPVYAINQEVPTFGRILVVDDFLIGGTSLREVYNILISKGVPKENIIGYCLGTKEIQ